MLKHQGWKSSKEGNDVWGLEQQCTKDINNIIHQDRKLNVKLNIDTEFGINLFFTKVSLELVSCETNSKK